MQGLPRLMPSTFTARALKKLFFNRHSEKRSAACSKFMRRALKATTPRSASPEQVPNVALVPSIPRVECPVS